MRRWMRCGYTDADGRYEMGAYAFGSGFVSLTAVHPDFMPARKPMRSPSQGEPSVVVNFVLSGGGAVEGKVLGSHGEPIRNATVTQGFGGDRSTRTDEQGAWRLQGLAYGRKSFFVAQAKGYALAYQDAEPGSGKSVPTLFFRMVPGSTYQGHVLEADGRPIADATIFLRIDISRQWERKRVCGPLWTDEQGEFRADGLPQSGITADVSKKGRAGIVDFPLVPGKDNRITMNASGF